jgi:hypothetical protein
MQKIFVRICSKSIALDVKAIRDIVYQERYATAFEDDLPNQAYAARAFAFETKELNVMDNCVFFYATSAEIEKLKEKKFSVEGFQMLRWIEL